MLSQNHLTLNVLNFSFVQEKLSCFITTQALDGAVLLSQKDTEFFVHYLKLPAETAELYTTFDTPCEEGIPVTLHTKFSNREAPELCWSGSFLKNYYTYKLCNYFRTLGLPVRTNFVTDTEVWLPATSPYSGCSGYKGFRLRVQFGAISLKPELLLTYDGIHSVYKKSLTSDELEELSPEVFNWVLYENKLLKYIEMPDDARRNADAVYPCLNKTLQRALNIPFPAPDKSNRYLRYRSEIDNFKKQYLYSNEIEQFIKVNTNWLSREPYSLIDENRTLNTLEFGRGKTDVEPKNGMRLYGPKKLSPDLKTVFFFICHRQDVNMASTVNAYLKGSMPTSQWPYWQSWAEHPGVWPVG